MNTGNERKLTTDVFTPPKFLRSTAIQTMLAGRGIREHEATPFLMNSGEIILTTIENVRLQGYFSPQSNGRAKGLVMLLHGWEGSADSAYILRTGKFLYNNGFSIFRLNYRDHGDTHHLNPGLFYAVLLDEVFSAVKQVSAYESELPFYLVGFSMGGNFSLRIARKYAEAKISNLAHVVSISPVLDPEKSTCAIDDVPLLRMYFRKKWQHSLKKKQACFPDLYDFSDVFALETLMEMTEVMLERYSDYTNASDYFRQYALLNDALTDISVPTTIITAKDDPIIPVDDFYDLKTRTPINLLIQPYGGHNGFVETISGRTWYEKKLLEMFQ